MSLPERPPLDSYTCEKIDSELHKFDELYWPKITAMRVKTYYAPDDPVPPPQPQHLLHEIEWYAERLFKVEADYYDQFRNEIHYGGWLSGVVSRVTARVMKNLETLESGAPGTMIVGYHGLAMPRIEQHLLLTLTKQRLQYEQGTSESQRGAALFSSATKDAYAKAGIDLSSAPPLVLMAAHVAAQGGTIEAQGKSALTLERESLRDSYLSTFPGAGIMDICWAAEQHYREWTRWLKGDPRAKNGSKPDRAFRRVLTSSKDARKIRSEVRPKGWK
jgi:hypothetical protein